MTVDRLWEKKEDFGAAQCGLQVSRKYCMRKTAQGYSGLFKKFV